MPETFSSVILTHDILEVPEEEEEKKKSGKK
jgi:hypothetical protein